MQIDFNNFKSFYVLGSGVNSLSELKGLLENTKTDSLRISPLDNNGFSYYEKADGSPIFFDINGSLT
jgi:hypothetical protein